MSKSEAIREGFVPAAVPVLAAGGSVHISTGGHP